MGLSPVLAVNIYKSCELPINYPPNLSDLPL